MSSTDGASGLIVGDEGRVGRFVYRVPLDQWWWSEEMYRIHGLDPQQVTASTEVLQAHKHPEDLGYTSDVLARAAETGEPFGCYHRIVDATGRTKHVVAVADAVVSGGGRVEELRGYLIDLSDSRGREVAEQSSRAVRGATRHRAAIEQAKGMIMFVYGVDAETAFTILSSRSQRQNIKVRELAEELIAGTDHVPHGHSPSQRLLTDLLERREPLTG